MITSRHAETVSVTKPAARAGAAIMVSVVAVVTVVPWTTARGQDAHTAGISDTSCVGGWTNFNCVTRWGRAGDPYVRLVPKPVDEAEKARLVARDRKWLARCNPIVERDRYGVARYRYSAPGCEFGVGDD
jgi:hypothetical protein